MKTPWPSVAFSCRHVETGPTASSRFSGADHLQHDWSEPVRHASLHRHRTVRRSTDSAKSAKSTKSGRFVRDAGVLRHVRAQAKQFVSKYHCAAYVETSALDGDGVDDAFDVLTKNVLSQLGGGSKLMADRLIREGNESRWSNGMVGSGDGEGTACCCRWC